MDISRALYIKGWMLEPELVWLAQQAETHKTIVEVGSYLGRSTRALGDNTTGVVYALDDWYGPRDDMSIKDEQRPEFYNCFVANMHGLLLHKVFPVRGDHGAGYDIPAPDMVFIDGSHTYADVHRDISYWLPRVAPGGLISGHDHHFIDVQRAVSELVPGAQTAPGTTIWYKEIG